MKITNFYEGHSDVPQKLRFLTIFCKSVLIFDRILLFVPNAHKKSRFSKLAQKCFSVKI